MEKSGLFISTKLKIEQIKLPMYKHLPFKFSIFAQNLSVAKWQL